MMKTKFNFWRVMAAAAIMFSAGVGYADATAMQTATHYNATPADAEDQTPNWQPITPGGAGSLNCTLNEERACKAIQTSPGVFQSVQDGDYPGL